MVSFRARLPASLAFVFLLFAQAALCQVPQKPNVMAVRDNADVSLFWMFDPSADGYRVYRTEDPAAPPVLLADTPNPQYTDPGAVPGPPANPRLYYYFVIAYNGSGDSPPSNWAFKINIPLNCPAGSLCNNYVAFPYLFFPQGVSTAPMRSRSVPSIRTWRS